MGITIELWINVQRYRVSAPFVTDSRCNPNSTKLGVSVPTSGEQSSDHPLVLPFFPVKHSLPHGGTRHERASLLDSLTLEDYTASYIKIASLVYISQAVKLENRNSLSKGLTCVRCEVQY